MLEPPFTYILNGNFWSPVPWVTSLVNASSLNPFYTWGGLSGSFKINPKSPYILDPITAILNSIKFIVKVPVLSLKTY